MLLTAAEADAHDELAAAPGGGGGGGGALAALRATEPDFVARVEATLDRVRRELFY